MAKGPQKISAKAKSGSQKVRLCYNAPYPVSACTLGVMEKLTAFPRHWFLTLLGSLTP